VGPSIRGMSDLSHGNFVFLELELDFVPNRTTTPKSPQ
jgi:hypothetical protein